MMKFIWIAKLFSVSLLEILTVKVCFSSISQNGDYNYCNGRGGESPYIVNAIRMPWHLANEFCLNKSSSLLVIQNGGQQNAFETYMNRCSQSIKPRIHSVWTSGKRETLAHWTWINGQTLNFTKLKNLLDLALDSDSSKTHVRLRTESMTAEPPSHPAWYLCQRKDRQCNGQNQVNLTNGCVISSEPGNTSWYESRNECLSMGGDLAVLTEQDLQTYNSNILKQSHYWIGLRKVKWVWKTNVTHQEEVKYTKWAKHDQPTSGELCISIDTADGQWTASECNTYKSVVCEKHGQIPILPTTNSITTKSNAINTTTPHKHPTARSTTTTSTTTSSAKYNNVSTKSRRGQILTSKTRNSVAGNSTITKRTTNRKRSVATSTTITITTTKYNNVSPTIYPDQQTSETTTRTMEEGGTPSALIIGVTSVGVVIIIICIIVIMIALCRTSKSSTKMEPKADEVKLKKTEEQKPKETAEVLKNDETRCIYADIPSAEKTANDQPGAGQVATVYASLEFDQEVTYAEPMKRKSQNPVDSVGPIYAEPFEAMGSQNGTTSSSSPSGQATKIGPMGDVYTLPSPNISSPSANMTQSPIYANTQT